MDIFKKWSVAVIGVCTVSAIIKMLMPNGNIKKCASVVLSLCVMLVMLTPISTKYGDFSEILYKTDFLEDFEYEKKQFEYNIVVEKAVENSLIKQKIDYINITSVLNIDDNEYIIIESIDIETNSDVSDEEIKSLVSNDTQFEPQVIRIIRRN